MPNARFIRIALSALPMIAPTALLTQFNGFLWIGILANDTNRCGIFNRSIQFGHLIEGWPTIGIVAEFHQTLILPNGYDRSKIESFVLLFDQNIFANAEFRCCRCFRWAFLQFYWGAQWAREGRLNLWCVTRVTRMTVMIVDQYVDAGRFGHTDWTIGVRIVRVNRYRTLVNAFSTPICFAVTCIRVMRIVVGD